MEMGQMRADVIERAINVEKLLSAIITMHFFHGIREEFLLKVLYDEACSFGMKASVACKLRPNLCHGHLQRHSQIRNRFAHLAIELFSADGSDKRIPNPRKLADDLDFSALYAEFLGLDAKIVDALVAEMRAMGAALEDWNK